MSKANELRGVSPIVVPGYIDLVDGLIQKGASVDLILTPSVLRSIGAKTTNRWTREGAQLYEIPAASVAFAVTESMMSLGLYGLNGKYDPLTDLDCCGSGAVRWGQDLYRHYRNQSREF
jgi:predicted transcriptional regulator